MRRKKKKITLSTKILNHIFRWKVAYIFFVILLILLYPVYVLDGQKWKFVSEYGIRLPTKYELHGIDVSHHNENIDWQKVRHSTDDNVPIEFAVIKATEGQDLKDQDFEKNWEGAKKVGLIRGAYHFYVPHVNPRLQAENFIESVKLESGDFAPVLDFELHGKGRRVRQNLKENIRIWLEIIENYYGIKPIIYTNRYVYSEYIKGEFDEYPLWMSDYDSPKLEGYDDANLLFWQHSHTGRLDGIRGNVDFNVFVGSKGQLNDICIQ